MNGPAHYRAAERLIGSDAVPQGIYGEDYDRVRADHLAVAQVHATLALAAAQAERWADYTGKRTEMHLDWAEVIS